MAVSNAKMNFENRSRPMLRCNKFKGKLLHHSILPRHGLHCGLSRNLERASKSLRRFTRNETNTETLKKCISHIFNFHENLSELFGNIFGHRS